MAPDSSRRPPGSRGDLWLPWERGPASPAAWVAAVGLGALLVASILKGATGSPEWLLAWRITTGFLLFTGALLVGHHLFTADPGTRTHWRPFAVRLALLAVLLAVVYRSGSPGIAPGVDPLAETFAIILAVVGFTLLADDPREYSQAQWLVLWCFGIVATIHFLHGMDVSVASPRARQPLWAAVVMGCCLVVLPRHLPVELFLWTLNRVAAAVILLGLATYLVGEYALWGVQFRFHGTIVVPGVGLEVPAIRSLFVNRNALGLLALSGLLAAVAEFHRGLHHAVDAGLDRRRVPGAVAVPAGLLAVNAVGFAASFGRALWAIAPAALGVYLAPVVLDREALPVAVAAAVAYVLGGILAVYLAVRTGLLASDPSDRFHLWAASLRAIVDNPSLLGEGIVSTANFILPYRDGGAPASPHSSYLTIWIRTGLVGGLAYVGVNAGSLLEGARRARTVDAAALALAVAFVAHQLFESYTLFAWWIGSVLGALSLGFVAFGAVGSIQDGDDETGDERT